MTRYQKFGFYFTKDSSISWRFPIAFQVVFAIIIMCTVLSLPESPRWLVKKGRIDEARQVFASLDGVPRDDPAVSKIIKSVEESLSAAGTPHPLDIFKMGKTRNFHRATLGFVSQCFQQIRCVRIQ